MGVQDAFQWSRHTEGLIVAVTAVAVTLFKLPDERGKLGKRNNLCFTSFPNNKWVPYKLERYTDWCIINYFWYKTSKGVKYGHTSP